MILIIRVIANHHQGTTKAENISLHCHPLSLVQIASSLNSLESQAEEVLKSLTQLGLPQEPAA